MPSRKRCRLLLLTPPLLQPNAPYPATMHLAGFLKPLGFDVAQRDLSIKVVRDVLLEHGDETTAELLEFLGGPAPSEAKRGASEAIERFLRPVLADCLGSGIRIVGGYFADRMCGILVLTVVLLAAIGSFLALTAAPSLAVTTILFMLCFAALGAGNGALFQLVPLRWPSAGAIRPQDEALTTENTR